MSKKSYNTGSKPILPNDKRSPQNVKSRSVDLKQSIIDKPVFLAILILALTWLMARAVRGVADECRHGRRFVLCPTAFAPSNQGA